MESKEKHNYFRWVGLLVGIIFAGGGYVKQIGNNSKSIVDVQEKTEANKDKIHVIQLHERDTQGLYQSIDKSLVRIEQGMGATDKSVKAIGETIQTMDKRDALMEQSIQNLERVE